MLILRNNSKTKDKWTFEILDFTAETESKPIPFPWKILVICYIWIQKVFALCWIRCVVAGEIGKSVFGYTYMSYGFTCIYCARIYMHTRIYRVSGDKCFMKQTKERRNLLSIRISEWKFVISNEFFNHLFVLNLKCQCSNLLIAMSINYNQW